MGWQFSGAGEALDPWLDSEPDEGRRRAVPEALAQILDHGDAPLGEPMEDQRRMGYVVEVPAATVRIAYMRVVQFHTIKLLRIEPM